MDWNTACINPLRDPPRAERILVIRLGAMGDVVRTLPAFAELRARYPDAHLAWLVEPKAEGVLRGQPGIDELIVFPRDELEALLADRRHLAFARRVLAFARELRARRFELVIDFHAILKTGLLAWATGARERVGYGPSFARERAQWFVNRRARIRPRRVSRFVRNAALVDFLGHPCEPAVEGARAGKGQGFTVDPALRDGVSVMPGDPAAPLVVLHPGSSAGAHHKRYPARAWAGVLDELAACGARCVVAAGPAEERFADEIQTLAESAVTRAPVTASIAELGALLEAADLFLGSDSGPLHLASLVGTPVVQVLGPTDPIENAPWPKTPSRSVRVPVGCSPCRRGCAAAACMTSIPLEAVASAARELLATAFAEVAE